MCIKQETEIQKSHTYLRTEKLNSIRKVHNNANMNQKLILSTLKCQNSNSQIRIKISHQKVEIEK